MISAWKAESLEWEIIRNGGTAKNWIELTRAVEEAFLEKGIASRINEVSTVYERAVRALPYSYKMWTSYIRYRIENLSNEYVCTPQECFQSVRLLFERAIVKLPKMPLLWVSYLEWVIDAPLPPRITMARQLFARSLQSLPTTQHHYIWAKLKPWTAKKVDQQDENGVFSVIPMVPTPTVQSLWRVYFCFDHSFHERVKYFTILFDRRDMNIVVNEWVEFFYRHFCSRTESAKDENDADPEVMLLHRPHVWHLFQKAFEEKGWKLAYVGEGSSEERKESEDESNTETQFVHRINKVVDYGANYVHSPTDFLLAYSIFLYGQGQFTEGRRRLRQLLEESPDPISFHSVYKVAVEVEDELVESFAQHPFLRQLNTSEGLKIIESIFGAEAKGNALFQLENLVQQRDSLLNQAQLRNLPQSVPLWLKRVELFLESTVEQQATNEDGIIKLWYQAIGRCTQGGGKVDISVGQLYESFAVFLLDRNRVSEAKVLLEEGAWNIHFSCSSVNAHLLGLLTEIKILSSPAAPEESDHKFMWANIGEEILQKLLIASNSSSSSLAHRKRQRPGLLTGVPSPQSLGRSPLKRSSLPWLLAFDILQEFTDNNRERVQNFSDLFFGIVNSPTSGVRGHYSAYTPEACAYIAFRFYSNGEPKLAVRELERGIQYFSRNPLGALFLVSQYISLLCFHYGKDLLLDTFREVSQTAFSLASSTMPLAPHFTVEVLMSCVAVESTYGLYSTALQMAKETVQLCTRCMPDIHQNRETFLLISGVVEHTISLAFFLKGIQEVRSLCNDLIQMAVVHSRIVQRICIHWAALEKRCGLQMNAHTIMNTYAETQNPDAPSGGVYWQLWESLCETLEEFEVFVRRRQQSRVRHEKKRKH